MSRFKSPQARSGLITLPCSPRKPLQKVFRHHIYPTAHPRKYNLPCHLQHRSGRTHSMDTLTQYRQHLKDLLQERAQLVWDQNIQAQTLFDVEHDHYQLIYVGWRNSERIYVVILHADIINNKIWIQQDGTEVGLANQLVELGVPKSDIVLAFDPPNFRKYTDFAIA